MADLIGTIGRAGTIAGSLGSGSMGAVLTRASSFWDPAYLPPSAQLVATADNTLNLGTDTSYDNWTPSTTNTSIKAAGSAMAECNYTLTDDECETTALLGICMYYTDFAYTTTPVKAYELSKTVYGIALYAPMQVPDYDTEYYGTIWYGANGRQTYYATASSLQVYASATYGIGPTGITFAASSITSLTQRIVGFTRPAIYARCNSTYFSTTAAGNVDSANTNIYCKYRIYKFPKEQSMLYKYFDAASGLFFT